MPAVIDTSRILALAAAIGPTLALYNALGVAPLFVVTALAATAASARAKPWLAVSRIAALGLAALVAWTGLSMLWTIEPGTGAYTTVRMLGFAVGGLILLAAARDLDSSGQSRVGLGLVIGVTIALVMATIEIYARGPGGMVFYMRHPPYDQYVPRLGRGLTVAAILLAPAMLAAWRSGRKAWALSLFVLALVVFAGGRTLSAKLALAASPGLFLLAWWRPRWTGRAVATVMIGVVLAFPLLALIPSPQETMDRYPWLPNSTHHRLTIWNFTANRILEHPVLGWGIEAARSIPDGETTLRLWHFSDKYREVGWPDGRAPVDEQLMPLHPHSAAGQVWLELGAVGAVLLCLLLALAGRTLGAWPDRIEAAVALTTFFSAFIVASVSYGFWQSWWMSTLWLTAVFCVALRQRPNSG